MRGRGRGEVEREGGRGRWRKSRDQGQNESRRYCPLCICYRSWAMLANSAGQLNWWWITSPLTDVPLYKSLRPPSGNSVH